VSFNPPLAARPEAVIDAIAAELRRNGNHVSHVASDHLHFEGPGSLFELGFSWRRRAARQVERGVVWIDPSAPDRRVWVELHLSHALYVWPCVSAAILLVVVGSPAWRIVVLLYLASAMGVTYARAVAAYEDWIERAARRAK
jgi:hypothetical protein